ncbi:MAG: autotransporter domain-containing protein [Akkermansia sp.]|nr:autotransporter domain-containing protein [Akkermansia sp.]
MKLHLPNGLRAALLAAAAFAGISSCAFAATLTTVATMDDLYNAASIQGATVSTTWEIEGGSVYSFSGENGNYIGGITHEGLTSVLSSLDTQYVTMAAWVNLPAHGVSGDGDGCAIFSYGGQSDGVKVIDKGGNLKFTTKGVKDFGESSSGSITLDDWTLVAVTIHKNGDNFEVQYMLGDSISSATNTQAKGTDLTFAIGNGNATGDHREIFKGEMGNFTVFSSAEQVTAADIASAMGAQPVLYAPDDLYWGRNVRDGEWNADNKVWAADTTSAGSFVFKDGKNAHFTLSGGGGTVTVTQDVQVAKMYVAGSKAYTFNANGGKLTVADSVNVDAGATAIFNTALSGEDLGLNANGILTLNQNSKVKTAVVGAAGQIVLGSGVELETTGSITMGQEGKLSGSGVFKTPGVVMNVTNPNDQEHQPSLTDGAVLETESISGNGVLHMTNSTLRVTGTTEISNVEVAEGAKIAIDKDAALSVNKILAFGPASSVESEGKLFVDAGGVLLIQSDLNLGDAEVNGSMMLDGTDHLSMTRGYIKSLNFSKSAVLACAEDLELGSAAAGYGTLAVTGNLTVGGIVSVESVQAGKLTISDDSLASLTVSGQLTAGEIIMEQLSVGTAYIKAGSLGEGTGTFTVSDDVVKNLNAKDGDVVVLADLSENLPGGTELSINGGGFILDETNNLLLMIAEDEAKKDIVLNVTTADYIWTDEEQGTHDWGVAGNWLGKKVPDAEATALVKSGTWTINMNEAGEADTLYFYRGADTKLTGDHSLSLGSELVVEDAAKVTVTDSVAIDTAKVKLNGELSLTDGSSVTTGALNGGTTGVLSSANPLLITGKGGVYKGSYGTATVELASGAEATLAAGKGLTLQGGGTATLTYSGKEAVIDSVTGNGMTLVLNGTNVDNSGNTLTSTAPSSVTGGRIVSGLSATATAATLSSSGSPVLVAADSLALSGTTVELVQTETNTFSMKLNSNGQRKDLVLGYLGGEDTNADVVLTGNLFSKYYENARLVGGVILVDLREVNFSDGVLAYTYNGRAGAGMLDDVYKQRDPQNSAPDGDLAAVMNAIESGAVAKSDHDRLAAAMAGASAAAMGYAYGKDVERQLHAIRNRTTGMGCAECVVNEDMPYVNAWVSAEGDFSRLAAENTYAGYSLNSWGGTVGCDLDFTNRFTAGLALTAMKGKFTSRSAEQGSGDLDRLYVSAFARYARRAWTHTFVGTIGTAEAKLDRTVSYAGGSYSTSGDTKGVAFGLMYEAGYTKALNESGSTCLQPLFSISYRHSTLDGYTERRSDAALHYSDIDMDVVTFSLGGRLQTVAGTSVYNRTSVLELRAMAKLDAGDRDATPSAGFLGVTGSRNIKSTETGSFGLELGAGLMVPVADDAGSLFFDVGAEFRSNYSDVNATVGYRVNF